MPSEQVRSHSRSVITRSIYRYHPYTRVERAHVNDSVIARDDDLIALRIYALFIALPAPHVQEHCPALLQIQNHAPEILQAENSSREERQRRRRLRRIARSLMPEFATIIMEALHEEC
ncbi:hypothetical protein H2248_000007 [Termitomyces sp. 'cryptogamus']|nr:hypothetical protein H2248_000007 [Termitomyces sp. 'cryptogamus']